LEQWCIFWDGYWKIGGFGNTTPGGAVAGETFEVGAYVMTADYIAGALHYARKGVWGVVGSHIDYYTQGAYIRTDSYIDYYYWPA